MQPLSGNPGSTPEDLARADRETTTNIRYKGSLRGRTVVAMQGWKVSRIVNCGCYQILPSYYVAMLSHGGMCVVTCGFFVYCVIATT